MKIQLHSLRVINGGPLRYVCIHFNTKGERSVNVLLVRTVKQKGIHADIRTLIEDRILK